MICNVSGNALVMLSLHYLYSHFFISSFKFFFFSPHNKANLIGALALRHPNGCWRICLPNLRMWSMFCCSAWVMFFRLVRPRDFTRLSLVLWQNDIRVVGFEWSLGLNLRLILKMFWRSLCFWYGNDLRFGDFLCWTELNLRKTSVILSTKSL